MRLSKALKACRVGHEVRGVVYVIIERGAEHGPCKIGYTFDSLNKRLQALQTGNHRTLEFFATTPCVSPKKIERIVHSYLRDYRIAGEWFAVHADDAVNAVRNAMVGFD